MENKILLKFTVFADFHYKQGMYISPVSDIEKITNFSKENDVDFIVHAGDYCNDYIGSPEILKPLLNNKYGLSVYGIYGNHELESENNVMEVVTPLITNRKETVVWGTADGKIGDGSIAYYYVDKDDLRIICLDTNYSFNEKSGEWQHNLTASYGAPKGNIQSNSLGPAQLAWLKKLLFKSIKESKKCIVVSHTTFNPEWNSGTSDSAVVLDLFKKVNDIQKGTVFMAINGHYHTNRTSLKDGILFFDVNTVRNGCWISNAPEHYDDNHTFDYVKYDDNGEIISSETAPLNTCWQSGNTWYFDRPLFAMVTIFSDGTINIEGSKAAWIYDVVPQNKSRFAAPEITGGSFKLQ